MKSKSFDEALSKVVDGINKKRREEVLNIYSQSDFFNYIKEAKAKGLYDRGNKSKSMRKIASMPYEVDLFFERVFGRDYYKNPDFFTKYAPEWLIVDQSKL